MIVNTALVPEDIRLWDEKYFDLAVVIDVLRATTTLLFAAKAGAKKIIPASTVERAFELKQELHKEDLLLCGERNGLKIPGFDLGNSPLEYTPDTVDGKIIIYASTNGSVMIERVSRAAKRLILASLRNVSSVVDFVVLQNPEKLLLACSGIKGGMSLEDAYAAGRFFHILRKKTDATSADDGTHAATLIYEYYGDEVDYVFEASIHGRYLGKTLGLKHDLEIAAQCDIDTIVLEYKDGFISPVVR